MGPPSYKPPMSSFPYKPRDSYGNGMGVGVPFHQEFQVPKMEGFLNLIAGYFRGGFSLK